MPAEADAKKKLTAFSLGNWRRPSIGTSSYFVGKDYLHGLKCNNLALNVAQHHPLWRLMSTFWYDILLLVQPINDDDDTWKVTRQSTYS